MGALDYLRTIGQQGQEGENPSSSLSYLRSLGTGGEETPRRGLHLSPPAGAIRDTEVEIDSKAPNWIDNMLAQSTIGMASVPLRGAEALGEIPGLQFLPGVGPVAAAGKLLSQSPLRGIGKDFARFAEARQDEQLGASGSPIKNALLQTAADIVDPALIASMGKGAYKAGLRFVGALEEPAARAASSVLGEEAAKVAGDLSPGAIPKGRAYKAPEPNPGFTLPALDVGPSLADNHINRAKYAIEDPTGDKLLTQLAEKAAIESGAHPKTVKTWEQTIREGKRVLLEGNEKALQADPKNGQAGALGYALREAVSGNLAALSQLRKELSSAAMTEAERAEKLGLYEALDGQTSAMLAKHMKLGTGAGRDLNAFKIQASLSNDPTLWVERATRVVPAGRMTSELRDKIVDLAEKGDREGLFNLVRGEVGTSPLSKIATTWKAGLLTSIGTHVANVASTIGTVASDIGSRGVFGAFADALQSIKTGQRTIGRLTLEELNAVRTGIPQALSDARKAMRGATDPEALKKLDLETLKHITYFGDKPHQKALQAYTDFVFNSLGAEDAFSRTLAMRASIANQAKARGLNVAEQLARPDEEIAKLAMQDTLESTFQDQTAIGKFLTEFQGALDKVSVGGESLQVGQILMPFTKTPGAVATRTMEYSPLGLGKSMIDIGANMLKKSGVTAEAQREASKLFGRGMVGTGLYYVGYQMAASGNATGVRNPMDRDADTQRRVMGTPSSAIRIGDTWIEPSRLGPLGVPFVVGATAYEKAHEPNRGSALKEAPGFLVSNVAAMAAAQVDQPMFTGLSNIREAVMEPVGKGAKLVNTAVAATIPAGVAAITRGIDPTIRQSTTLGESMQARIPGQSTELPASIDPLGQPKKREWEGGLSGVLESLVSPLRRTKDKRTTDPLLAEVDRINAALPSGERQVLLNYVEREITDPATGKKRPLTDEEFRTYQTLAGQDMRERMTRLIQLKNWNALQAEQKAKILNDQKRAARESARSRLLMGIR